MATGAQGASDLLHLPVNTEPQPEVTYEHDSVASAGTERACAANRIGRTPLITMATQQRDRLLPLSVLLYSGLVSVDQRFLLSRPLMLILMLMVSIFTQH